MRTIWNVQTDNKLPTETRKAQRQTIVDNGLEPYARFADEPSARKFADKIKRATGIALSVTPSYPVDFKVL